ncbi:MAG: ribonuclease R, partial [Flavobacteriales bacterium]|nr:ribonuclease R [Flavobacteriales bacterium]
MAKKKKNKQSRKSGSFKHDLLQQIITVFDKNPAKSFNYKQLSSAFGFKDMTNKKLITIILLELVEQGKLRETQRGKFSLNDSNSFIEGRVDMTSRGAAYIVLEGSDDDIYINPRNTNTALNGDTVKVNVFQSRHGKKAEGEVVEIVERNQTEFVGILEKSKNFSFVITDSQRMPVDIFISNDRLKNAQDGDKVIAKMTEWPLDKKNPFGKIVQVLGRPGENNTEMHAILAEFGLPHEFTHNVEKAAEKLDLEISAQEIKKRRDFRTTTTFTIDPKDA